MFTQITKDCSVNMKTTKVIGPVEIYESEVLGTGSSGSVFKGILFFYQRQNEKTDTFTKLNSYLVAWNRCQSGSAWTTLLKSSYWILVWVIKRSSHKTDPSKRNSVLWNLWGQNQLLLCNWVHSRRNFEGLHQTKR